MQNAYEMTLHPDIARLAGTLDAMTKLLKAYGDEAWAETAAAGVGGQQYQTGSEPRQADTEEPDVGETRVQSGLPKRRPRSTGSKSAINEPAGATIGATGRWL